MFQKSSHHEKKGRCKHTARKLALDDMAVGSNNSCRLARVFLLFLFIAIDGGRIGTHHLGDLGGE
jgi:hypothetical protein